MKIYANGYGHMTMMVAMPIYCKIPLKLSSPGPEGAYALGILYVTLGTWGLPSCLNNGPRLSLTHLAS